MSKLKLTIDRALIEGDEGDGYCYISRKEESGTPWIEIHGNMTEKMVSEDYPLCLGSNDQIDQFAEYLKKILRTSPSTTQPKI